MHFCRPWHHSCQSIRSSLLSLRKSSTFASAVWQTGIFVALWSGRKNMIEDHIFEVSKESSTYYFACYRWSNKASFRVQVKFVIENCRVWGDDLIYWTKKQNRLNHHSHPHLSLEIDVGGLVGCGDDMIYWSTLRCECLLQLCGGPDDRLRAVIISDTYTEKASIKFDGFSLFLLLRHLTFNIFLWISWHLIKF